MSLKHLHISFSIMAIFAILQLSAQAPIDSLTPSQPEPTEWAEGKLARPQLEIGTGVLSYFGDVGNLGGYGKSYDLNWGYNLSLKNRISKSFGLNLSALFGKVSSSEQFKAGNANFETQIRMGSLALEYNFDALLPETRNVTPYISLGISTFEFNPKGDLYDAGGNKYHFWDDGTIRQGVFVDSEAKSNANTVLVRDGVYETDLRETNDRTERYALRSFSVPVGAGVLLKLTESFTMRMGAEFHYTLTDNIDNINSENTTYTTSKKGHDYLLYSSVGLAYNLHYFSKNVPDGSDFKNMNLDGLEYEDEDSDGVADIIDLCPFTPSTVSVDMYGCPLDYDADGVADYVDNEPNSDRGAIVNSQGVTLSDADLEEMYLVYSDSIGNLQFKKSATYTASIERKNKTANRNKGYRVEIANTADLDNDEIAQILSIPDIKYDETPDGISYYIGNFENPIDALSRTAELSEIGIESTLVYNNFGDITEIDQAEIDLLTSIVNPSDLNPDQVVFRVQIGAYRQKLSKDVFSNVNELLVLQGNDGLTRYHSGSFATIKDAAAYKINLLLKGFEGAFVTAYRAGDRISLKDAGATVKTEENISTKEEASGSINSEFVKFTIQLGSFDGRVPADVLSKYMNLGNVRPLRGSNGATKYVYNKYETQKEATQGLTALKSKGFEDAFIVGDFNGQIISLSEAKKIKDEK